MDVELLSRMIAEVVVDHDKVGLLGIGTFYAEIVPSNFSDRGYTINPPYRRLFFLSEMAEEDVLVEFYAKVNFIPVEVAREYLKQFFSELKEKLKERKSITLPGLGRLRATKENNFFFVPDEQLDIYPETFGMGPVSLKSLSPAEDKVEIQFEFKVPDKISEQQGKVEAEKETEADTETDAGAVSEDKPESEREPAGETEVQTEAKPEAQPETEVVAAEEGKEAEPEAQAEQKAEIEVVSKEKPETKSSAQQKAEASGEPAKKEAEREPEQMMAEQEQIYMRSLSSLKSKRSKSERWTIILIVILIVILAFVVFMALAQLAPEFVDSILYTPEELEIINFW